MGNYCRPSEISEAIALLATDRWTVLAGGTDIYPARLGASDDVDILDITNIDGLRQISETKHGFFLGSLLTWSDLIGMPLPSYFDALKAAARDIGGVQIQNAGTIGGNLCNASPAADSVPVLLVLDAEVVLQSAEGHRRLPLSQFLQGNRKTNLKSGELLTQIFIPKKIEARTKTGFHKYGARKYLVISTVMSSGLICWDKQGVITDCAIAVGACSEVAQRLSVIEKVICGTHLDELKNIDVKLFYFNSLKPLSDVRSDKEYRLEMAILQVRSLLNDWSNINV
jgi:CO/xanthine dehydrogenase FAD-binding subunit